MKLKASDILKFIVFDVLSEPKPLTMALNVQKIKEVVEVNELSVIPDVSENVIGIYDLRGTPVPVFDIIHLLSKSGRQFEMKPGTRILICDLQKMLIGFPVTKTGRTISCASSAFLPPPKGGQVSGKKIISGLIKKDEIYIPVLDLDSILEMVEPETSPEAALSNEGNLPSYPGKRVLVVEDSKTILKKLVQVFTEMGFSVDTATNGFDGLDLAKKDTQYDLIFTDIEMPLLDGISMARKIREISRYQATPILFNSALSNPALISDIEEEKLGRYIVKYDKELIYSEVETAMKKTAA